MERAKRRGKDMAKLKAIMAALVAQQTLPPRHRDHALVGNYIGRRECHVEPDWLLIYLSDRDAGTITFERTGTHADLFE